MPVAAREWLGSPAPSSDGETLAARISGRPLDLAHVLDIVIQVADALDAAHTKGTTATDTIEQIRHSQPAAIAPR